MNILSLQAEKETVVNTEPKHEGGSRKKELIQL